MKNTLDNLKTIDKNLLDPSFLERYFIEDTFEERIFVAELIDSFRKTIDKYLNAMEEDIANNDYIMLKKNCHALKGASINLGATQLSKNLLLLEQNVQRKELIIQLFDECKETAEKTILILEEVKEYLEE